MIKISRWVLITLVFAMVLSACGSSPDIVKSAKNWFTAVTTMDMLTADDMTCMDMKESFRQMSATGGAIYLAAGQFIKNLEIEIDDSKITYKITDKTSKDALVSVSGELRGSISGMIESQDVDEVWKMTKEDGVWKWCGYAGGNSNFGYMGDNSVVPEGEELVSEFEPTPTPIPPTYKIEPLNVYSEESKNAGWTKYYVVFSLGSNVDYPFELSFDANEGEVITDDGGSYRAILNSQLSYDTKWRSNSYFGWFDDTNFILPPGAKFSQWPGDSMWGNNINNILYIQFEVPTSLVPKSIIIDDVVPVDLSNIINSGNLSPQEDYTKSVIGAQEFPYQSSGYDVNMTLSNPRIVEGEDHPYLAFDVDLENTIKTGDSYIKIIFSAIDSDGVYYHYGSDMCIDDDRDHKITEADNTIGPSQTIHGRYCVSLEDTPSAKALKNGNYIIIGKTQSGIVWLHVHAPR